MQPCLFACLLARCLLACCLFACLLYACWIARLLAAGRLARAPMAISNLYVVSCLCNVRSLCESANESRIRRLCCSHDTNDLCGTCIDCRTCIERTDRASLNRDSLVDLVGLVLDNAGIAVSDTWAWHRCSTKTPMDVVSCIQDVAAMCDKAASLECRVRTAQQTRLLPTSRRQGPSMSLPLCMLPNCSLILLLTHAYSLEDMRASKA